MSGKPGMKRPRVRLENERERLLLLPTEDQMHAAATAFRLAMLDDGTFDQSLYAAITAAMRAKP